MADILLVFYIFLYFLIFGIAFYMMMADFFVRLIFGIALEFAFDFFRVIMAQVLLSLLARLCYWVLNGAASMFVNIVNLIKERNQWLYTNNPISKNPLSRCWSCMTFKHPATFDTLAMDPTTKQEIMADLDTFRKGKDHYSSIGKAWMRSYLLYGPLGIGKSPIITAMANYMGYDIYSIDFSLVKTNSDLRKILLRTTSKSIIILNDIECIHNLTTKVTLSELLDFIDGPWYADKEERLLVFTTNHAEKLETISGRMDKLIHVSSCRQDEADQDLPFLCRSNREPTISG